jgi:hypothetical protein
VLVSDNASTDDTPAILQSFHDSKLRVLTNSANIGLCNNWNQCLREARGEYFIGLSDDDALHPTFVEKCSWLLQDEPGLPIVAGAYEVFIAAENRIIPAVLSKRLQTGIWNGTDILKEQLRGNFTCATLSMAIRTDILRRNGGFPAPHVHEELSWGRVLLEGRAGLINEPCASHVFHSHTTPRYGLGLDMDARLGEACSIMEELSKAAGRVVASKATCQQVQSLTKRYVAHRAYQELAFYRSEGASLLDVVRHLRSWRKLLARCTFFDFVAASRLRLIGRILSPTPVIRLVHLLEAR